MTSMRWLAMTLLPVLVLCLGLTLGSVPLTLAQTMEGGYRIFRPDGPGPHPGVVFVSGCSGFTPAIAPKAYERSSEQLRALGFVVVWADMIDGCCTARCQRDVGEAAVAAAAWLRAQPGIDAGHITAMGWSFGGGAVLAALGRHTAADVIFTRTIAYYPYCADVGPWSHSIPVLVLWGDSDTVAPHHLCKSAFETSRARGANITIIDYPGARHAFDVADLPPKMEYRFGTVGYHPQAAAEAWKEVTRFLGSTR